MAWTTPGTAVAGDVLTAAFWNEQVRDNMTELAPFFGEWTTYTPTLTNITLGSGGTNQGRYLQIGKFVVVRIKIVLGSGGSFSTGPQISVPFDKQGDYDFPDPIGVAKLVDVTGSTYEGIVMHWQASNVRLFIANVASTYPVTGTVTNTAPFTWTDGDYVTAQMMYEAA